MLSLYHSELILCYTCTTLSLSCSCDAVVKTSLLHWHELSQCSMKHRCRCCHQHQQEFCEHDSSQCCSYAGVDAATSTSEDAAPSSSQAASLRPLAISLLCGMAHSTHRTRHELWAQNVVTLLLDLLKEEVSTLVNSDCMMQIVYCWLQAAFMAVLTAVKDNKYCCQYEKDHNVWSAFIVLV